MTSTSIRVPGSANRNAGHCIEDDQRSLNDQLRRCVTRKGYWRLYACAERMRAFTARHVMSVAAGCALAGGLCTLIR